MIYKLKSVTVRTDNSTEGMGKINELWRDIMCGKYPLNFIENGMPIQGMAPISEYSNYENDEKGEYDLSVTGVSVDFFTAMEKKVEIGEYIKIDEIGVDISDSANKAWQKVWQLTAEGKISRAFTRDYESTVPAEYTQDGKAHCVLYIAVK